mmetsp:Transcript_54957/g.112228  ORF Transcript_54957/g.112228 Transcript_54957/m.112228 type:complete len:283 (-) Transcript_54957:237-1085(-)
MKKQRSPGPAAYNIGTTISKASPAYSFGTMKRPAPGGSGISPGPVYQLKTSVGRNRDFTFKHNPSYGFGTGERPDPAGQSRLYRGPGPGEYGLGSVVGPEKPPPYKSAPSFGFGTAPRLPGEIPVPKRLDRSTLEKLNSSGASALAGLGDFSNISQPGQDDELGVTPGPGQYDGNAWKKKRPPAFSFGTSAQRATGTRAAMVPGPGQYKRVETTGGRTSMTLRKGPAFGFGTAKLGGLNRDKDVPGPGSYPLPSSFGTQYAHNRTLPQFSFGTSPRETGIYE